MIDAAQASDLVERLTGAQLYLWQKRLLHDWLLTGRSPAAVDVPTGLGKTRVMALWLAARALGASLPRRLVYVVDRRTVVDQASREAQSLRERLPEALAWLGETAAAECWRRLGLTAEGTLPVSTLRGQFAGDRRWLDAPQGAAIIVGTVDMIGSRLLFAGYGVGSGMRPVHAGLLGADTFVLIDEAHLVPPFKALVRAAAAFDRPQPVPAMRVMTLSATGAEEPGEHIFSLATEDSEDALVKTRLDAPKRLALHETHDLVESMVERALELGQDGKRVIVFCNQRDKGAREVEQRLRERTAKTWGNVTTLLVGARRGLEREPDEVLRRFMPSESHPTTEAPAFLVATSAGEVGIDLDADHLVGDLVAWERMVQRLGRVNRTGRAQPAMVDVFWSRSFSKAVKEDAEDELLDERLIAWRAPFESPAWPVGEDGRRPAGPGVLLALKQKVDFIKLAADATTPEPLRPALTRPLADAWAMTSLDAHPGRPRIEPWLRGWVETRPQTNVIWRRVLPVRSRSEEGRRLDDEDRRLLKEFFSELPPHLTEVVEADTTLLIGLLKSRVAEQRKLDGAAHDMKVVGAITLDARNVLAETFTLSEIEHEDAKRLTARLAGRTVVLDSRLGGLSKQGLLDPKAAEPPTTLDGETAPAEGEPGWTEQQLLSVGRRLRTVSTDTPTQRGWVRQAGWSVSAGDDDDDTGREWRIEKLAKAVEVGDAACSSKPQVLQEHQKWTEVEARELGLALGLSEAHRVMLETAARVHDAGKARERWQTAMGADRSGRPYAKTTGRNANPALLEGYRHEFGSLRDAEADFATIEDKGVRELCRHIVAAHHGHGRPAIRPVDPDEPPFASEARAREAALRFARLQDRWGPWGLAWWEALLRAADWAASRRNEQEHG